MGVDRILYMDGTYREIGIKRSYRVLLVYRTKSRCLAAGTLQYVTTRSLPPSYAASGARAFGSMCISVFIANGSGSES